MTTGKRILICTAVIAGSMVGWMVLSAFVSGAKSLSLSAKDYGNGSKRAAAAEKKTKPVLSKALGEVGASWGAPVYLQAFKEERLLELWVEPKKGAPYQLLETYPIEAASGELGPKKAEGDRQVPEGFYQVTRGNLNPESRFHLSFNIGYPNKFDKSHGRTGSFIMVHGGAASIGCLAMGDPAIEEIYTLVAAALKNGQKSVPIAIFPFRPTAERLQEAKNNPNYPFWLQLADGYQFLQANKRPPRVKISSKSYSFR